MVDYELSNKADEDLTEIYTFSYNRFGELKADAYLLALEECFCMLAEQPPLGKKIDNIRAGYLQYEHTSHSIFYMLKEDNILIQRVLHQRMDSKRHL